VEIPETMVGGPDGIDDDDDNPDLKEEDLDDDFDSLMEDE